MYHIGVGSNVVCSTTIGNARASIHGTDNKDVPTLFYALNQVDIQCISKGKRLLHLNSNVLKGISAK